MVKKLNLLLISFLLTGMCMACGTDSDSATLPEEPPVEVPGDPEKPDETPEKPVLETPYTVPFYGNTYVTKKVGTLAITEKGITDWDDAGAVISLFFRVSNPGTLNLAILGSNISGKSELKVTIGDSVFLVSIDKATQSYAIGQVNLAKAGYVRVDIQGISKSGKNFGDIVMLKVGGEAAAGKIGIVPNDWTYWGRRGPSVHMGYTMPAGKVQYFYNEVTVPRDNDVMNSYFMCNGFGQGYMGMQVNSETERRVLFSVWSPYETDNPGDIPEDYKIILLRQGKDVQIGEFGNEGSGGQSYLKYMWKPGVTYKFLTEVQPDGNGNTDYTGYFDGSDGQGWRLIASFRRPHTDTWYTGAHSFLENFNPEMGYAQREVYYDNQWVRMEDGTWKEMTVGTFTYDNTAASGIRFDYAGGLKDGKFYLKNCGFFNENTPYKTVFTRPARGIAPVIDFNVLENIPSVNK